MQSSKKNDEIDDSLPNWAIDIRNLLKGQRLTQQAFAARMNVTQATVSLWLSGKNQPRPEMFFRMAKIWPQAPEYDLLLTRAEDSLGTLQVPGLGRMRRKPEAKSTLSGSQTAHEHAEVLLLKDADAVGTARATEPDQTQDAFLLPLFMCPHPEQTFCIAVKGDSMSPLLEEGYIVAVDTSQTDTANLAGHMVAARDARKHVAIKWLRKSGKDLVLVAQNSGRRHQPVILSSESDEDDRWSIVGKVLWWIGTPT